AEMATIPTSSSDAMAAARRNETRMIDSLSKGNAGLECTVATRVGAWRYPCSQLRARCSDRRPRAHGIERAYGGPCGERDAAAGEVTSAYGPCRNLLAALGEAAGTRVSRGTLRGMRTEHRLHAFTS